MAAIPEATPHRDKVRFLVSRPVFRIPQLVGFHSGATRLAISTRLPEPERFLQRPRTKIRLLAPGRFSATAQARATPPMEHLFYLTMQIIAPTPPLAFKRSLQKSHRTGQHGNRRSGAFFNDGDPTNNEASYNVAFGNYALFSNTTGYANSAFGSGAIASNTSGSFNTADGFQALGQAVNDGDGTVATGNYILSEAKLQRRPEDFRGEARLSISDYPILAAH